MFKYYRVAQSESLLKKTINKFLELRKDVTLKLKQLKSIIEMSSDKDVHTFFRERYSIIYFVFFENFLIVEANLKSKGGQRSQRDELDSLINLLELIFIHLPHLLYRRWQYRSIYFVSAVLAYMLSSPLNNLWRNIADTVMQKLLHPQNSYKVRKDGIHLLLLWLAALNENAFSDAISMYANLVPGLKLSNGSKTPNVSPRSHSKDIINISALEVTVLLRSQASEKSPENQIQFFIDTILECMVLKIRADKWQVKQGPDIKSFEVLWDLFTSHYIRKVFPDFNFTSNLFVPYVDLYFATAKTLDNTLDNVPTDFQLVAAKASVIKWIIAFASPLEGEKQDSQSTGRRVSLNSPYANLHSSSVRDDEYLTIGSEAIKVESSDSISYHSIVSDSGLEIYSSVSLTSLEDVLFACTAEELRSVQAMLFSSRKNVNLIQEVFRLAFRLPMSEAPTITKVIQVYRSWIQAKDPPIFMQYPKCTHLSYYAEACNEWWGPSPQLSANQHSSEETSQRWRAVGDTVPNLTSPIIEPQIYGTDTDVCAGPESTYQFFISSSAFVFVSNYSVNDDHDRRAQIDICKKVLSVYRYMIANLNLSEEAWIHFLRVFLYITRRMMDQVPKPGAIQTKSPSLSKKLAESVFQTLIVSWIKANLCISVSKSLWDELVDLLSTHCNWEELIVEWSKNMEIVTKILSRRVYHLELTDLPLDRLTEQKSKRRRGEEPGVNSKGKKLSIYEQVYNRGVRRSSIVGLLGNAYAMPSESNEVYGEFNDPNSGTPSPENSFLHKLEIPDLHFTHNEERPSGVSNTLYDLNNYGKTVAQIAPTGNSSVTPANLENVFIQIPEEKDHRPGRKRRSSEKSYSTTVLGASSSNDSEDGFEALASRRLLKSPGASSDRESGEFIADDDKWSDPDHFCRSRNQLASSSTLPYHLYEDGQEKNMRHSPSLPSHTSDSNISTDEVEGPIGSDSEAILPEIPEEEEEVSFKSFCHLPASVHSSPAVSRHHSAPSMVISGDERWPPVVVVVLWRRLLGVLGDVNAIEDARLHEMVFQYLVELLDIFLKMRQNIGIALVASTPGVPVTAASVPEEQELVPPMQMLTPWAFKAAMGLPDSHRDGKLHAFYLLCKVTIQRDHDMPLEQEHLAQFYTVLHEVLHSKDEGVVNKVVGNCSDFFSCGLPGCTLLLLDFIKACRTVCLSTNTQAPKVEAQIILGSVILFPSVYPHIPVIGPKSSELAVEVRDNLKESIIKSILYACKNETNTEARCVALACSGLWLFDELTSVHVKHKNISDAINDLIVSLKSDNYVVANTACSQLRLLSHCSKQIRLLLPAMPGKIIEILSLTLWSLIQKLEITRSDLGRQLIISHLFGILEWCMAVPLSLLVDTLATNSEKQLIRRVFKRHQLATAATFLGRCVVQALTRKEELATRYTLRRNAASMMKAIQSATLIKYITSKTSSSPEATAQNFEANVPLDQLRETGGSAGQNKTKSSKKNDSNNIIKLTANMVLKHLMNYLGHFPLPRGTSILSSIVSENHDISERSVDELTPALFHSPQVQFMVFNDMCLMSVVEMPSEDDKPGGGPTAGMTTPKRCVRFIVRDAGGKYCWDSSILHGPPNVTDLNAPVVCKPSSDLDQAKCDAAKRISNSYKSYAQAEEKKIHTVEHQPIPQYGDNIGDKSSEKLDQLLQYLGSSSPEIQNPIGFPLNVPASLPPCLDHKLEKDVIDLLLSHHQSLQNFVAETACKESSQWTMKQPQAPATVTSPFYYARLLCTEFGFLSRDSRQRLHLLKKNERLLRELKNLDAGNCRETHKVAVFYIANGQEDKMSILSNTGGSKDYEGFVSGLGWEVDLARHCGFRGKLQSDGSTGTSCPYYATSTLEVIFHVATRFPSADENARNVKIRHLGNDEVHIVWSEHHRDYRRGIIPTEFGDVLIVIYPIRHGLYKIQIMKKDEIPYFGPLFDGAVVHGRILPVLVRETAINAGRAKRSLINLFQSFYEERHRYLNQIITQYKDNMTFEDYCSNLYNPNITNPRRSSLPKKPRPAKMSFSINSNNSSNRSSSPFPIIQPPSPIGTPQTPQPTVMITRASQDSGSVDLEKKRILTDQSIYQGSIYGVTESSVSDDVNTVTTSRYSSSSRDQFSPVLSVASVE